MGTQRDDGFNAVSEKTKVNDLDWMKKADDFLSQIFLIPESALLSARSCLG